MLVFQNIDQWWLWLLALAWLAVVWLTWRRDIGSRRWLESQFGSVMSRRLSASLHAGRRRWRAVLLLLALLFAWLAAARPQWGWREKDMPQQARDVALVFDVAWNESVEDAGIEGLDTVRRVAGSLLEQRTLDRFAIVAFAGEAFLECPLTWDREILLDLIDALSSQTIPVPGSNPAAGLREARQALAGVVGEHRAIILFSTDWTGWDAGLDREIELLREARIPVFTVGAEAVRSVAPEPARAPVFEQEEREDWHSLRQPGRELSALAVATGGLHVSIDRDASPAGDRLAVAIADSTPGQYARRRAMMQPVERYQWPLALAVLILVITFFIDLRRAGCTNGGGFKAWPLVGALALIMAPATDASRAAAEQTPTFYRLIVGPELEKLPLYLEWQRWQQQLENAPSPEQEAVIFYNLGRIQQALGALPQAANAYRMAVSRFGENEMLRAHSLWNLGTVEHWLARRAMPQSPAEAKLHLVEARSHYQEAMQVLGGLPGLVRNYQALAREHALLELVMAGRSLIEAERRTERVETEELSEAPFKMFPIPPESKDFDEPLTHPLDDPRWMPMTELENGEETAWNDVDLPFSDLARESLPPGFPEHDEEAYLEEDLTPDRVGSIMESVRDRQRNFRQFLKEQRFGRD